MSSKILLQFFLLSVLIIISTIFYFKYVHKSNFELKIEENNQIVKEGENKIKKNLVKDIKYESFDNQGNVYIIQSDTGEFNDKNKDIIFMTNVNAVINFTNGTSVKLQSNHAKYNTSNNDTNFIKNVNLDYLSHKVRSENLDIFFKDNKLEAYNDLDYKNLDLSLIADKVEIDLLTKDAKIYMFDKKKIKVKNY